MWLRDPAHVNRAYGGVRGFLLTRAAIPPKLEDKIGEETMRAIRITAWLLIAVSIAVQRLDAQPPVGGLKQGLGMDVAHRMVVAIEVATDQGKVVGSGIILSSDGVIATPAHLLNGARSVKVRTQAGDVLASDGWLYIDVTFDLAYIRVNPGATELTSCPLKEGWVMTKHGAPVSVIAGPGADSFDSSAFVATRLPRDYGLAVAMRGPGYRDGGAVMMPDGQILGMTVRLPNEPVTPDTTFALPLGFLAIMRARMAEHPRPWTGQVLTFDSLSTRALAPPLGQWWSRRDVRPRGEFRELLNWWPSAANKARWKFNRKDSTSSLSRPGSVPAVVNDSLAIDWFVLDSVAIFAQDLEGELPTMEYTDYLARWSVSRDSAGISSVVSTVSMRTHAANRWFGRQQTLREVDRTSTIQLPEPARIIIDTRDRQISRDRADTVTIATRLTVIDTIAELWIDGTLHDRIWVPRGIIPAPLEELTIAAIRDSIPNQLRLWLLFVDHDTLALGRAEYWRDGGYVHGMGFRSVNLESERVPVGGDWSKCSTGRAKSVMRLALHLEGTRRGASTAFTVSAVAPHLPFNTATRWCVNGARDR